MTSTHPTRITTSQVACYSHLQMIKMLVSEGSHSGRTGASLRPRLMSTPAAAPPAYLVSLPALGRLKWRARSSHNRPGGPLEVAGCSYGPAWRDPWVARCEGGCSETTVRRSA
jgi:hypothetical protein